MASVQRIAVYSIADLKNTTDDAVAPYLRGRKKYAQSYLLSDVRLALGYSAVAIAAIIFYLDYTRTWQDTKLVTLWAVAAYFVLNSALTLWIWGVEKGKIFTGSKGESFLVLESSVNRHTPSYRLSLRYTDPETQQVLRTQTTDVEAPFTKWFTADGRFIGDKFYEWLDSTLPIR